jgi:hypothetical protein
MSKISKFKNLSGKLTSWNGTLELFRLNFFGFFEYSMTYIAVERDIRSENACLDFTSNKLLVLR